MQASGVMSNNVVSMGKRFDKVDLKLSEVEETGRNRRGEQLEAGPATFGSRDF
jgi:hypothetical protein